MHAHDFVSLLRSLQLLLVSKGGPAGVEPLVGLLERAGAAAWGCGLEGAVLQERGLKLTALECVVSGTGDGKIMVEHLISSLQNPQP